jgi:sulfur relay (sulfurtransferase) complex TusBCD TusD component (DsrE family)
MNVIYLFMSSNAALILDKMIIPQIQAETHGANVVGLFFFADNVHLCLPEHPIGEKLSVLATKHGFFLACCDFCCVQRGISGRLYPGVLEGCFPDLYRLAGERKADHVITL